MDQVVLNLRDNRWHSREEITQEVERDCAREINVFTFRTKISPVVRFISNLLFAGLFGSIPWPVRK